MAGSPSRAAARAGLRCAAASRGSAASRRSAATGGAGRYAVWLSSGVTTRTFGPTVFPGGPVPRTPLRNLEQTVTAPRGESRHGPAFLLQPGVQRVGAEVAAHHEGRAGTGGEQGEPAAEQ